MKLSASQENELQSFEDNLENYCSEFLTAETGMLPFSEQIEDNFRAWCATVLQGCQLAKVTNAKHADPQA